FDSRQRKPHGADGACAGSFREMPFNGGGVAMMYYLHLLSEQVRGFNVFSYVTFRAIAAAVTAFVLSLACGPYVIKKLIALKIGQPIRTADEVHRLAELHSGKKGVPTMGGVLVIGAVVISSVVWARPDNRFVWLALFTMVYLGALGFADDYSKVTKKKSAGISGRLKLVFQIALALIVSTVLLTNPLIEVQARSLSVPFHPYTGELAVVCAALVGAGLGFLWFNCHPAKVIMGDTGALAIGGVIGVIAICCKQELLLVVVGGVFVIEAASVILQVLSFRLTGKRIFAMSPIHHHFELSGWKENTVIVRFWILSAIFALL